MSKLIFVHGAFANKHSWFGIPNALASDGHDVTQETLKGHKFPVPVPEGSGSLEDYVEQVRSFLSDKEESWLIGHSMGGMVISQVAADEPEKVAGLIYIAAVLPQHGDTTAGVVGVFDPRVAFSNHDLEEIQHALSNQPPEALSGKFATTPAFADIGKYYFVCSQDRVIAPPKQKSMASSYDNVDVFELDSDHLPMHPSDQQPDAADKLLSGLRDILSR